MATAVAVLFSREQKRSVQFLFVVAAAVVQ